MRFSRSPERSYARPAFTLGDMVRQLRIERGLSQVQLALRLGLSGNAYVSRIERGAVLPSGPMQRRLADELGVEPALLAARVSRESHGSTATALLSDIGQAFEGARARFADEVEALSRSLGEHQVRLAHTLRLSELQLLWGLADKLAYEATVQSAWVLSPDLELDASNAELREVVRKNLERGVEYRFLVPAARGVLRRARVLRSLLPRSTGLEVRVLAVANPLLVTEVVLYDARSDHRLGLMVAPTERPDVDCVLSAPHARRLVHAYATAWRAARPL